MVWLGPEPAPRSAYVVAPEDCTAEDRAWLAEQAEIAGGKLLPRSSVIPDAADPALLEIVWR